MSSQMRRRRRRRVQLQTNKRSADVRRAARNAITRWRSNYELQRFKATRGDGAATWQVARNTLHRDHRQQVHIQQSINERLLR